MRLWPCLCRADGQYHRGRCVNTLVGLVCVSAWVDCVHPLQRAFPLCSLHTVPSAATRCRPHMPPPGVEAATLPSGMRGALVPAHACSHRGKDWCPPFLQPHFCLHRTEAVPRTGALTPQGACVCVCVRRAWWWMWRPLGRMCAARRACWSDCSACARRWARRSCWRMRVR